MKGSLIGVIFGGLVIFAVAATGVYLSLLPHAPVINSWALNKYCLPVINFTDKDSNEDGYRIFMRPQGMNKKNFTLLKVLPFISGKGTALSVDLPPKIPGGTYEYRVSAYNSYGEASHVVTVDATSPNCSDMPSLPIGDPMQILVPPLITAVSLQNQGCDIKVEFVDFNTPQQLEEDGIRIYRLPNGTNGVVVDTQPPTDSGSFTDMKLPAGMYQYMVSAYKGNDELYSSYSLPIQTDPSCGATVLQLPSTPTVLPPDPLVTPKKLSCEWQAAANVFLRKGPDVILFDRLVDVQSGKILPVIGQSEDGTFWAVEVSPGVTGYITKSEKYSRISGDCGDVPTLTDPAPPEIPDPAATRKPGDGGSSTLQCSDGIDNDGDGLIDYSPTGSGDPSCSSADDASE